MNGVADVAHCFLLVHSQANAGGVVECIFSENLRLNAAIPRIS